MTILEVHPVFIEKPRTVLACGTRASLERALSRGGLGVGVLPGPCLLPPARVGGSGPRGLAHSQTGFPAGLAGLLWTVLRPTEQPMLTPMARSPGERPGSLGRETWQSLSLYPGAPWLLGPLCRSHTQQYPQALCLSCRVSSRLCGKDGDPSFLWLGCRIGAACGSPPSLVSPA